MLKPSLLLRIVSSNAPPLTKAAVGDVDTIVGVATFAGDLATLAAIGHAKQETKHLRIAPKLSCCFPEITAISTVFNEMKELSRYLLSSHLHLKTSKRSKKEN